MPEFCTVIVLGMHRSGTSALTGILEAAGLQLGAVSEYAPDNLKGNRESTAVMALHDDILLRNGGSWDIPPSKLEWSPIHYAFRDTIIETHKNKAHWGFKDPRTLLTLTPWLKALPQSALVGIFRHPYAVAQSLYSREGMPYEKSLALWTHYNRILLWHYRNTVNMPIIEFSENDEHFIEKARTVIRQLGLSEGGLSFFDRSLKQTHYPNLDQFNESSAALSVYETLRTLVDNQLMDELKSA